MKFEPLPSYVVPKVYDLTVDSDLESFTFTGKLTVDICVSQATKEVLLNSLDLDVSSAVLSQDEKTVKGKVNYIKDEERISISFDESLSFGDAHLAIEYNGRINSTLRGYYRTEDSSHPGKFQTVTQFQATDARRAFPSWDEPAIKAQFDITLIVDKELTALSNMHEVSSEPLPGNKNRKVVKFARTPLMSTYLVGFSVGRFDFVERKDKNGVLHRVYADQGRQAESEVPLELSVKSLEILTDFFNIKYPLAKCDNLAVQRLDFGAMENWGMVTYRSSALLVNPKGTPNDYLQIVHEIIAHELSHQWFGNLVTMQWWTEIWLNEGFASFLQQLVPDLIRPDFDMWAQFVSGRLSSAFTLDSLRTSHPVEVDIGHPSEVDEVFDTISYDKGCSLNRMLYFFLGKERFTQGLTNYLNHFAYKNATTIDLWNFLGEAAGLDLKSMMQSWTRKTGFPVVTIEEMVQLTPTKRQFKLTQKRHLDAGNEDELKTLWNIPISVITKSSPDKKVATFVMKEKMEIVEVEGVGQSDWFHFNPGFVGMYLIKYPKENINLLKDAFLQSPNGEILSAESRACVLFEMLRLATSGEIPVTDLLEFVCVFKQDNHYLIWHCVIAVFKSLSGFFYGSGCDQEKLKKFKLGILENIITKCGFEEMTKNKNSHLGGLLCTMILNELGSIGHPATVDECRKLFRKKVTLGESIPVQMRETVLKTVAINTTSVEDLDALIELYDQASSADERKSVAVALGCMQTEELAKKSIEFVMSPSCQIESNQVSFFRGFAYSYQLGDFLIKYCADNFEKICQWSGGMKSFSVSRVLAACTSPFYKLDQLAPAERMVKKYKLEMFRRRFEQNKETVSIRETQIKRDGKELRQFIDKF